jgi:HAD superfamily hydrolase (TIGR01509 family)
MIEVLMLDLGGTLIDDNLTPFPHVAAALTAIGQLKTNSGKALPSCLVSDFTMPQPPVTNANIDRLFREYIKTLEQTGLDIFFQPAARRVTLSTQAGVRKPDRRIFETALQRLGSSATLQECLFITEDAAHIAACRALGMQTLRFGAGGDFTDWSQVPLLISGMLGNDAHNTLVALQPQAANHDVELKSIETAPDEPKLRGRGRVWKPVFSPKLGDLNGVYVPLDVGVEIQKGPHGQIESVQAAEPAADEVAAATSYVESLARHKQIRSAPGENVPGATHEIREGADGKRRLQRVGFT